MLAESTEWAATAARLKELMTQWKAAPRGAKEVEQKLWDRFRAAQDAFFAKRSETFAARDAEQKEALERKQELVAAAEAIDVTDAKVAHAKMRELQGQWHDAGRVPRDAQAGLDRRLRAVEDRIREAADSAWRKVEPSANPLLTQMREQVAEAEQRLARAQAAGDQKRIREAQQALDSKRKFLALAEQTG
jgi:hypothetical protein